MNFEGPAVFWVQSAEDRVNGVNWDVLCRNMYARFGRGQHNNLIRQFYRIHQEGTIVEYIDQLLPSASTFSS